MDPRFTFDPATGSASWTTPDGQQMTTAYEGLPSDVQAQYQQHVADQYTQGMQAYSQPFTHPDQQQFQTAPDTRDLQAFNAVPASGVAAGGGGVGAPVLSMPGQFAGAAPVASQVRGSRTAPTARGQQQQPAPSADATQWADPVASVSGGASPGASPQQSGDPRRWGGLSLDQLRAQEAYAPGSMIGGSPGRRVMAEGPSHRQFLEMPNGGADYRGAQQKLTAAQAETARNVEREMQARAQAQDAMTMHLAASADAENIANEQVRARQDQHRAQQATQFSRYQQMVGDQAAAEAQGIDPNHWWSSKSTGDKIMSGIGIMLGGIGAGMAGHPEHNVVMDVINDAISRDMSAQRENIAGKGRKAEAQRGLMAQAQAMFDDEMSQNLAFQAGAWRATERQIAAEESNAGAADTRAKLEMLRGQVGERAAQAEVELQQSLGQQVTTSTAPAMVGGSRGVKIADILKANPSGGAHFRTPGDLDVPDLGGRARTVGEAVTLRQGVADANNLNYLYDQMINFRSKYGNMTSLPERARMEVIAAATTIANNAKTQANLGALAEADLEIITALSGGDPTAWNAFGVERFKQAKKNTAVKLGTMQRSMIIPYNSPEYGGQGPATRVPTFDDQNVASDSVQAIE